MIEPSFSPEQDRLEAARAGSKEAIGQALEACRNYLLLIANQSLDPALLAKGGASDMVQATFLEAHRDFRQFTGKSSDELRIWLRQMLLHNIADFVRNYHKTDKRDVGREVAIDKQDSVHLAAGSTQLPTPSRQVIAQEQVDQVTRAIAQLSEDHQMVIRLRNQEDLPFDVIAQRLGRTEDATRKLWFRAIQQLRSLLNESP
jgi:RNA polymerase sigma-70 factor (ECF subfamily)